MSRVILKCIRVGGRLRVRFDYFINEEGIVYENVYDNTYNCRFPRNIREEGLQYEIPDVDISLSRNRGVPFYNIKTPNIKIIKPNMEELLQNLKVFEIPTCVICMESESSKTFFPCGHKCTCQDCCELLCSSKYCPKCPLCRRTIDEKI